MNIGDLINACGNDVQMQLIDECVLGAQHTKAGTKLTIGTHGMTPRDLVLEPEKRNKIGFLVWLDRAQVRTIIDADKSAGEQDADA